MQQILNSSNMKNKSENESNNLVLEPPPKLSFLFKQFNNTSQINDQKDPKNVVKSKHYNLEKVQSLKILNKNSLFLFHINNCLLNKNFEDLEYLI